MMSLPSLNMPLQRDSRFNPYDDNGGSIVAIAGDNFAVIGSDTRLSTGFSIYSRTQSKLFNLTDMCIFGSSGCWSDAFTLSKLCAMKIKMYQYDHRVQMPTESFAQMLSILMYYKRFFPYYVSNILAGVDSDGAGVVYSYDPIGHCEKSKYKAGGTSGALLQPLLDNQLGFNNMQNVTREPITVEKALDILEDVFVSAAERDIYTGDRLDIYIVTPGDRPKRRAMDLRKD